jgi:hypothetical protein
MHTMKQTSGWILTGLFLLAGAAPAVAQIGGFGGFGQASAAMMNVGGLNRQGGDRVVIRPWAMVNGTYSSTITPTTEGRKWTQGGYGGMAAYGAGGHKSWQRTSLGVAFTGVHRTRMATRRRAFNSHFLTLGVSHLAGPRTRLFANAFAGYGNGGMGMGGGFAGGGMFTPMGMGSMMQMSDVGFGNPMDNGLVDNELFDAGVLTVGSSAGIAHQIGSRWTVSGGGGTFLVRRRQRGLAETQGFSAYAMTSYRLDRTSSIGLQYAEQHFSFRGLFGNNRARNLRAFYNKRVTQNTSIFLSGGGARFMGKRIGVVQVDPFLRELLGGVSSYEVREVQRNSYVGSAGVTRSFRLSHVMTMYSRMIAPGNGIVLGSTRDLVSVNSNIPLGAWSIGVMGAYMRHTSLQQQGLRTETFLGAVSTGRAIGRGLFASGSAGYRDFQVSSGRAPVQSVFAAAGLTWMPRDAALVF